MAMATMDLARDVATRHAPVNIIQDSRYEQIEHEHAMIDVHATQRVKAPFGEGTRFDQF